MELLTSLIECFVETSRPMHFRGKTRLMNHIGPRSGTRCSRIFGADFELDLEDFIQRQIYLGVFEPHETRIVRTNLRPGGTFVDVGANVGYYTAMAANIVGQAGRVYAFEPSPYAFARLRCMVDRNRFSNVTVNQCGLSDAPGTVNLYLGRDSHNHTPTMVAHENSNATSVAVDTLDNFGARLGIDRIDLLKIDVEGYEPRVLAGAQRLLQERRIGSILCEFNEHWLSRAASNPEHLEDLMRTAGFKDAGRYLDNRYFTLS
jgi:FkbM family methyltransferase